MFMRICLAILVSGSVAGSVWGAASMAAPQDEVMPEAKQDETPAAPTADDLMGQAMGLARQGELDKALDLIDQARALEPDDARISMTYMGGLNARGAELVQEGKRAAANAYFYKAAKLAREMIAKINNPDVNPRFAGFIYNEACSLALEGETDRALEVLDEAFGYGWDDLELVRSDADLASLRENSKFAELVARREREIVERIVAETSVALREFESFDFSFDLPDLDQKPLKSEDLKGKVVVADFWGTWCPPCREEIPHFVALKEAYGEKGLEVVGLTYEHEEGEEAAAGVREFMKANGVNYPCLIGDEKTMEQVPDFEGYPTTLFIDRQGKVRLVMVGSQSRIRLETVIQMLLDE